MNVTNVLNYLSYIEPCVCILALILMQYRRQIGTHSFLSAFLVTRVVSTFVLIGALRFGHTHPAMRIGIYRGYFYVYWISYAIEALLALGVVYSVYRLAMVPLRGLQSLGMLMFRWAAAISVVVALGMALGTKVTSTKFLIELVSQLQQTQSILTLCMLLFVTFAIRPMGLSYRSRIFGVSFGLGLLAASDLVGSAWLGHQKDMVSVYSLFNAIAVVATITIWTIYFALPEPKRRMIVLPTTSPFLRWNQISLALGDNPGFVAVGGIPPDMLAPAELEVMRRSSGKLVMAPAKM